MASEKELSYWRPALMAFAKMSGWVAGPVLIGAFLGKWLDAKLGTAPILFAAAIGVAFLASSFGIVREAKKYMKKAAETDNGSSKTNADSNE